MNPVVNDFSRLSGSLSDWPRLAWTQAWQVTLSILVVALIVRAFAKRHSHLAHLLWLVVLIKCVTPPVLGSPTGVFSWLSPARGRDPATAAEFSVTSVSMATAGPDGDSFVAYEEAERTGGEPPSAAQNPHSVAPHVEMSRAPALLPGAQRPRAASTSVAPWIGSHPALDVFGSLWLAGIVLAATATIFRWRRCFLAVHRAATAYPEISEVAERLARRLGLRQRVRVKITADTIGPAVIGLWRPTVVLPEVIVRDTAPRDLEPILAHELLHVRRGDLWIGTLQLITQWLWWWHPLVWWANRLTSRESERCCDEAVVAELNCPPLRYAKCLVDVLERKNLSPIGE